MKTTDLKSKTPEIQIYVLFQIDPNRNLILKIKVSLSLFSIRSINH